MFSSTDHGGRSATASCQDMVDYQEGISVGSGGKVVGYDLHRRMTGNRGAMASFATNI